MSTLSIITGIPGSGKSTFAHKNFPGVLVLENDMFHMHNGKYDFNASKQHAAVNWCFKATEFAMMNGMDVVVSNTFTQRRFIQPYADLAKKYGYEFKVYHMNGKFDDVHNVPKDVKDRMAKQFEIWPNVIEVQ